MQFYTFFTQDFLCMLSHDNKEFNIKEPFKGLFTQGMVCHETYKDQHGNWVSPEEIFTKEGKNI